MKTVVSRRSIVEYLYPKYLILPVLVVYVVFFIIPIIGGIIVSFTNWDITRTGIEFNGFDNYTSIIGDSTFKTAVKNTLIFAITIVVFRNVIAVALAMALNSGLKTSSYLKTAFFIPAVLSYVVVGIMFNALLQMDGTFNQLLNFIGIACKKEWVASADTALLSVIIEDIWKWTGFHMMIYIAGLSSIPNELYEAARIDGASSFKQFRYLTLPLLAPALKINITQSTIGGFRVFEQVLTLTKGGPGHESTVVGMMIYEYFGSGFYGKSTAATMLLSAVVVVVTISIRRYFDNRMVEY
jgi:raffinose/stachyose/melibiose transport system permease protein